MGVNPREQGKMDFTWGQKVSATDGWAGRLRGAVVSASPLRVTHLTVRRGLVLASQRSAPAGLIVGGDTESVRLGVGLVEMLALPNADSEPPGSVALSARTWVHTPDDGERLRLRGVRVVGEIRRVTHVIAGKRGARQVLLPVAASDVPDADGLRMTQSDSAPRHVVAYRRDEEIEGDLQEALRGSPDVPEVDLNEVRVRVTEGMIRLEGNTRSTQVNRDIDQAARAVRGCVAVENRLFSDWEINLAAASRITRYAPSMLDRIVVNAQFGVLHLEGTIHDESERQALTQAVRATPGILGIQWPALEAESPPS